MTIPTEVIVGVLGIFGILFGAAATRVKNQSQKELILAQSAQFEAEGKLATIQAEAEARVAQARADAEVKMSTAKDDAEERGFMRAQLQAQIKLNEQFQNLLLEKEKKDESNYRVLANVQADTNVALVNLMNKTEEQHAIQIAAIGGLSGALQTNIADSLKEYAQQLGAEIGAVITKQFQMQSLDREMFPFPDPEDPAWTEKFIVPATPTPTIHKQPYYSDAVKLRKPCAVIAEGGEWLRVIVGRLSDWIIVEKRAGDSHCWGWLPAHTVQVGEAVPA
jgi:hypothetical protein